MPLLPLAKRIKNQLANRRKVRSAEETYLLEVCKGIQVDVLKKVLSGEDSEKEEKQE